MLGKDTADAPEAACDADCVITLPPIVGVLIVGLVSVLLVSVCVPVVVTIGTVAMVDAAPKLTPPDVFSVMLAVAELGSWMIVVLRVAVISSPRCGCQKVVNSTTNVDSNLIGYCIRG
jgi:hypothetical protein